MVSVRDGVMVLTLSVRVCVVLDRVSTTLPILRFIVTRLPLPFCCLLVRDRWLCSLAVSSASVWSVLGNAWSTLLLSLPWIGLILLGVARSFPSFTSLQLTIWRRLYSWGIDILCPLYLWFWDLHPLCYNKIDCPAQTTRHILLYIRLDFTLPVCIRFQTLAQSLLVWLCQATVATWGWIEPHAPTYAICLEDIVHRLCHFPLLFVIAIQLPF